VLDALCCECLGSGQLMRVTLDLRDEIRRAIENITKRDRSRAIDSWHEHRGIAADVIEGEAE
jgi:hypothetical protein